MSFRGVRGATTSEENSAEAILKSTQDLLKQMMEANQINVDDIASIFLSTTEDLNAEFPAKAARNLGLNHTPLLCLHEMDVPHGLKSCIRILIHFNSALNPKDIQHIYLKEAQSLRPDHVST